MLFNVLSVDVEEYFHAAIFTQATHALVGRRFETRVEENVDRLLGLLQKTGTKGTFFILGEIAVSHPSVVRAVQL